MSKQKRRGVLALLCLALAATLSLFFSVGGVGAAEELPVSYGLVGRNQTLASGETSVRNPYGEAVAPVEGVFRPTVLGDYVIGTAQGPKRILRVLREKPAESESFSFEPEEEYVAGTQMNFAALKVESEIGSASEDAILLLRRGETVYRISGGRSFRIPTAGIFEAVYEYTDPFGDVNRVTWGSVKFIDERIILTEGVRDRYAYGQTIDFSDAYGYYLRKQYPVEVYLIGAEKQRLQDAAFLPEAAGEYRFSVESEIYGTRVTREISVTVESDASSYFGLSTAENTEDTGTGVRILANGNASVCYKKPVDLAALDLSESLISLVPDLAGGGKITSLTLSLIDVYDEENVVDLCWRDRGWSYGSYLHVGFNGYTLAIRNEANQFDYGQISSAWGALTTQSLAGLSYELSVPINVRYDVAQNRVYTDALANQRNYLVLDLDDAELLGNYTPFRGFTNGKVYLKIQLTTSGKAGVVLQKIAGKDLAQRDFSDLENSDALLFAPDFDADDLLKGAVGYPYRIPEAETSAMWNLTPPEISLYDAEDTDVSDKIENGIFVPETSGTYRLVYSFRDNFNRSLERELEIEILERPQDIYADLPEEQSVRLGSYYRIPDFGLSGGTGRLTVTTTISYNGRFLLPDGNFKVLADQRGSFFVVQRAEDEIGFYKIFVLKVQVETDFCELILGDVPNALRAGSVVEIPEFEALDRSVAPGESGYSMAKTVLLNGVPIEGKTFSVPQGTDRFTLTFCGGAGTDREIRESRTIRIIPMELSSVADLLEFDREAAETEVFEAGVRFSFEEEFTLQLPHALPVYGMRMRFSVLREDFTDGRIFVRLTDALDTENRITFEVLVRGFEATLIVNGKEYAFSYGKGAYPDIYESAYVGKEYLEFDLILDNEGRVFASDVPVCSVSKNDAGDLFKGFREGAALISLTAESEGNASLILNAIANQSFNQYTDVYDNVAPFLTFERSFGQEKYDVGKVFSLPKAWVGDVLQWKCTASLTITSPSGRVIAENVAIDEARSIPLDENGDWTFAYRAEDAAGIRTTTLVKLYCEDLQAPVLLLPKGFELNLKRGERFVVPKFSAEDNLDTAETGLTVSAFFRSADGSIRKVEAGESLAIDGAGHYELFFYARDGAGNFVIHKFEKEVTL